VGTTGEYRVANRGASNLHYPVVDSALDIPPWTRRLEKIVGDYWEFLENQDSLESRITIIEALKLPLERENLTPTQIALAFEQMSDKLNTVDLENLRDDEFDVLSNSIAEITPEFEAHPAAVAEGINEYVKIVNRVSRLREIRVYRGFTRINPYVAGADMDVCPISVESHNWLPATELRGEGIFIGFDSEKVAAWASTREVVEKCAEVNQKWHDSWSANHAGTAPPIDLSPGFLLIHTFSHLLMRTLTDDCGYSSASLRERIYCNLEPPGALGVLIYTGTPDSDGTLGGLQSRANTNLFRESFIRAIEQAKWCSSDPICIHSENEISDTFSGSNCHSCTMVSETSCEHNNRFIDRALVVGTPENPAMGFFSHLINGG
jgi:hypothetical protein